MISLSQRSTTATGSESMVGLLAMPRGAETLEAGGVAGSRGAASAVASGLAPMVSDAAVCARQLLSGLYPASQRFDRRSEQRHPFPRLFVLTPVDATGETRLGDPMTAVGKQLSETGLSFYHPQILQHRWVIATVENVHGQEVSFLMDVDWCRFTSKGWYESGGRFLRAVASPNRRG